MSLSDDDYSILPLVRRSKKARSDKSQLEKQEDDEKELFDFIDKKEEKDTKIQQKLGQAQKAWPDDDVLTIMTLLNTLAVPSASDDNYRLCFCRVVDGKNIGFFIHLKMYVYDRSWAWDNSSDPSRLSDFCNLLINVVKKGKITSTDVAKTIDYGESVYLLNFVINLLEKANDLMETKKILDASRYTGKKWEIFDCEADEILYLAKRYKTNLSKIDNQSFYFYSFNKEKVYPKKIIFVTSDVGEIFAPNMVDLLMYDGIATNEVIIAKIYPKNEETTKVQTTQNTKKQKMNDEDMENNNNNNNNNNTTSTYFTNMFTKLTNNRKNRDNDDDDDDDFTPRGDDIMQGLIDSIKLVLDSQPSDTQYFKELLSVPGFVLAVPARKIDSEKVFVAAYIDDVKEMMESSGVHESTRPNKWPYLRADIPIEYFRQKYPSGNKYTPVDEIDDPEIAANLNRVIRKYSERLLNRINVVLVTSGRCNSKNVILVYIRHLGILPYFDTVIESSLDGIEVVVVEGYINLHIGDRDSWTLTRPLTVGLSIGCSDAINTDNMSNGTITDFCKFNNEMYALSAGHILPKVSNSGIRLIQPSYSTNDNDLVSDCTIDMSTFRNPDPAKVTIDAALFKLRENVELDRKLCTTDETWKYFSASVRRNNNLNREIQQFQNVPSLSDECADIKNINDWRWVFKMGGRTGLTVGFVTRSEAHLQEILIYCHQLRESLKYYNQLSIKPDSITNTLFSEPGDSGAMVWILDNAGKAKPFGMVVAGFGPENKQALTTITPIKDIEEHMTVFMKNHSFSK